MQPGPDAEQWSENWSEADHRRYLLDRVCRLTKLLNDRESWQRTTAQLGGFGTLAITWTDHEGQEHDVLLTQTFLAGHARLVRAAADDLITCGDEGQRHAHLLFAAHSLPYQPSTQPRDGGTA